MTWCCILSDEYVTKEYIVNVWSRIGERVVRVGEGWSEWGEGGQSGGEDGHGSSEWNRGDDIFCQNDVIQSML